MKKIIPPKDTLTAIHDMCDAVIRVDGDCEMFDTIRIIDGLVVNEINNPTVVIEDDAAMVVDSAKLQHVTFAKEGIKGTQAHIVHSSALLDIRSMLETLKFRLDESGATITVQEIIGFGTTGRRAFDLDMNCLRDGGGEQTRKLSDLVTKVMGYLPGE